MRGVALAAQPRCSSKTLQHWAGPFLQYSLHGVSTADAEQMDVVAGLRHHLVQGPYFTDASRVHVMQGNCQEDERIVVSSAIYDHASSGGSGSELQLYRY
jgi:hypothetical protein